MSLFCNTVLIYISMLNVTYVWSIAVLLDELSKFTKLSQTFWSDSSLFMKCFVLQNKVKFLSRISLETMRNISNWNTNNIQNQTTLVALRFIWNNSPVSEVPRISARVQLRCKFNRPSAFSSEDFNTNVPFKTSKWCQLSTQVTIITVHRLF